MSKRTTSPRLGHVDTRGAVRMVDVGDKPITAREAVARGRITMSREAVRRIRTGAVKKGDPLQTARLAGIMAAKRTADVIPLCHPLPLSHADVTLSPLPDGYEIEARVRTSAQTGVEMEALHAVAVAALTIYDIREFRRHVRRARIRIAVIAVPAEAAQGVVSTVVSAGIKAILNFSPGALEVPPEVKLKSVDLTVSLESLSFFLARGGSDA